MDYGFFDLNNIMAVKCIKRSLKPILHHNNAHALMIIKNYIKTFLFKTKRLIYCFLHRYLILITAFQRCKIMKA